MSSKGFSNIFLKTQNTILSAAFILFVASASNAFLGLIKSRLLAKYFGISSELAIFYTADRIPNLFYSVLIVGAISTIFIPVFTSVLKKDEKNASRVASSILTVTLLSFIVLGTILFVIAPSVISLLSVGTFTPDEIILGSNLMRIMIAAQVLLVLGSLFSSILQSYKYFLPVAIAPVLYNLGMIFGIVFFSNKYGIYGPAYGVLIGATFHMASQLPTLIKTGFKYSFSLDFKDKDLIKMLKLIPPRILSVLIANLIDTVNNSLAILVSASSVVFLKFATQLQAFPVNLFGLSIAAAALPTLASESEDTDLEKFKKTFVTSLHQMLFLVIPASLILLVLRIPVVRLVYGVSNFPWEATVKTSYSLAFFSLSIFSQSINYLITRAFYALKDTKTPVVISIFTLILNVFMSITFITSFKFGVWSVAFAYSITSIIDSIVLLFMLDKKTGGFEKGTLITPFTKISFAGLLMAATLYIPLKLLDQYIFDTSRTINLMAVTFIAVLIGCITYLLFTKLFNVHEIQLFYRLIKKLNISKKEVPELTESENNL